MSTDRQRSIGGFAMQAERRSSRKIVNVAVTSGTTLTGRTVAFQTRYADITAFAIDAVALATIRGTIGKDPVSVKIDRPGGHPAGRVSG